MTPQNAQCGRKALQGMRNGCHHQYMPAKAYTDTSWRNVHVAISLRRDSSDQCQTANVFWAAWQEFD